MGAVGLTGSKGWESVDDRGRRFGTVSKSVLQTTLTPVGGRRGLFVATVVIRFGRFASRLDLIQVLLFVLFAVIRGRAVVGHGRAD